jgi:hypothetical protein
MDEYMGEIMPGKRFQAKAAGFLTRGASGDRGFDREPGRGIREQDFLAGADDRLYV